MFTADDHLSLDELAKPIKSVEEKWKLLPHFLKMRGLMKLHIDSFNHFVNVDMKEIVAAKSNNEVTTDADPRFFLRYTDISIGLPTVHEEAFVNSPSKHLRSDMLYSLHSVPYFTFLRPK